MYAVARRTIHRFRYTREAAHCQRRAQPFNVLVGSWKGSARRRDEKKSAPQRMERDDRVDLEVQGQRRAGWRSRSKRASNSQRASYGTRPKKTRKTPNRASLSLTTPDKSTVTYVGTLKEKVLTLDRTDGPAGEQQRLVFSLLHNNRHLYRYETARGRDDRV